MIVTFSPMTAKDGLPIVSYLVGFIANGFDKVFSMSSTVTNRSFIRSSACLPTFWIVIPFICIPTNCFVIIISI